MLLYGLFVSRASAGAIVCQSPVLSKIFVDGSLNLSPLVVMTQSLKDKELALWCMHLSGDISRLVN